MRVLPSFVLRALLCLLPALAATGEAAAQTNSCPILTSDPCIQITSLENYSFGTWSGVGDLSLTQRHCVRVSGSNASPGLLYNVTLTAVGGVGGSLRFTVGPSSTLQYEVTYANADGSNASLVTTSGGTATGFSGLTSSGQLLCNTNDASLGQRLTVRVTEAQLNSARAGSYGGTLQITVAPQ